MKTLSKQALTFYVEILGVTFSISDLIGSNASVKTRMVAIDVLKHQSLIRNDDALGFTFDEKFSLKEEKEENLL